MKLSRLFAVLSIIVLFVISESVIIVHAETLTKDFGETNFNSSDYSGYNIFCTIDVTATIQTEANGNWIENNTYQVNWTITITYLNQSIYDNNDFFIDFYNPENNDNTILHTVTYETTVTPQESGTLSATFRPESGGRNFTLDSAFALKAYRNEGIISTGSWLQSFNNEPIQIIVENQSDNDHTITPYDIGNIFLMAGILGIILVIAFVIGYLYRNKK
jgi:hypothetical protein